MKTKIILISLVFLVFQSCDPDRFCTDPSCMYSDVNTQIEASLSGNLDSIISVGDTIRFYMKIPQTINTNFGGTDYGVINMSYIMTNSYFGEIASGLDSITSEGSIGRHPLESFPVIYSTMPSGRKTWNYDTGEYECIFIPSEKGRYRIELFGSRLEVVAQDLQEWLINPQIVWDSTTATKVRYNQFLQWMDSSMHAETLSNLIEKKCWYCFEVQ